MNGAVAESPVAHESEVGERDVYGAGVVAEGVIAKVLQRGGEACVGRTVGECTAADGCEAVGEVDFGESGRMKEEASA